MLDFQASYTTYPTFLSYASMVNFFFKMELESTKLEFQ